MIGMTEVPIREFQASKAETRFSPFEYNGDTQFSSLLVDYGSRMHGLYFDTKEGLSVRSADRTTNKITSLEFAGKPTAGWLIIGSKSTNRLYAVPLNESDIRDPNYGQDVAISDVFVKKHTSIKEEDVDAYAVVTLNPDTQSFSVFHSIKTTAPIDFHPGVRLDSDNLDAIIPDNTEKDVTYVGSSSQRKGNRLNQISRDTNRSFKLSAQERSDIRRQKGAEKPEHHGVPGSEHEWDQERPGKQAQESRERRDKELFDQEKEEALEHRELGERISEPKPLSKYTHQSHRVEPNIIKIPSDNPDTNLHDRFPDPPSSPRLTKAERREFQHVKKVKNFGGDWKKRG